MDPLRLPFDRFCNLVWYWLTRAADEKRLAEVEEFLARPLPGETPEQDLDGEWSADAEMAAFEQAARIASSPTG